MEQAAGINPLFLFIADVGFGSQYFSDRACAALPHLGNLGFSRPRRACSERRRLALTKAAIIVTGRQWLQISTCPGSARMA
jgi:hypothetical protein